MEVRKPGIGSLNEKTLHRQLKELCMPADGVCEQPVGGYLADVLSPRGIVEIQTGNFGSLRKKLAGLLEHYPVRLVYPVTAVKTILVYHQDGSTLKSRRKSPKKQTHLNAVAQLLYIHEFIRHPRFEFETMLIEEEEMRVDDGRGSWRRRGVSLGDRRMVTLLERKVFRFPRDYLALLPETLPEEFTTGDMVTPGGINRKTAGQISYLLKKLELIRCTGKRGNSQVFTRNSPPQVPL